MTKAKGNSLQSFNDIVAAFSKSIGIRAVKSVEDIGLPVFEYPSARGEFGKLKTVAGIKPFGEQLLSGGAAFCVHKLEEKFLQSVSLVKPLGEMEHHVHSGPVILRERGTSGNQQPSGTLEMLPGGRLQLCLHCSPHIIHRPGAVACHMKAVNHDSGLREEGSGNIAVALVHIHHHILHILAIGKGTQVGLNGGNPSVRQNIQDTPFFGSGQDTLKSFTVCVAFEFIKGKHPGQRAWFTLRVKRQTARDTADRGMRVLHAPSAMQQLHNPVDHLIGKALIFAKECASLRKTFSA